MARFLLMLCRLSQDAWDMYATWNDAATEHAKRAHLEWYFHTWGIEAGACDDALRIFNNAMSLDSLPLREQQLSEFRAQLVAIGVQELAYAEWPESDSEGCHSYALVLEASEEQMPLISQIYERVVGSRGWDHSMKTSSR